MDENIIKVYTNLIITDKGGVNIQIGDIYIELTTNQVEQIWEILMDNNAVSDDDAENMCNFYDCDFFDF